MGGDSDDGSAVAVDNGADAEDDAGDVTECVSVESPQHIAGQAPCSCWTQNDSWYFLQASQAER